MQQQPISPTSMCLTCKRNTETNRLISIFRKLDGLDEIQRTALEYRYILIISEFSRRCIFYSIFFHGGHLIITVGSLIVPALLSIQPMPSASAYQDVIYWITWVLSLLVTTFNGLLVLFKVDKKYYYLHTTAELLRSEGWQFIQQTGRYAGQHLPPNQHPSHANHLKYFCNHIEKIRMRQIEEEYYKYDEAATNPQTTHTTTTASTATAPRDKGPLYIESISKPITTLIAPATGSTVKDAVNSIVAAAEDATATTDTI